MYISWSRQEAVRFGKAAAAAGETTSKGVPEKSIAAVLRGSGRSDYILWRKNDI
jgi:hypothetical protein